MDFCVHNSYDPSCTPLLPPETCKPIQMYQASGTPYNPPGCRYVGSKTYIDWNKVNKFDLAVDVSGIIGTIGLGVGQFGIIPGDLAYGISEAAQVFGLVHDVSKVQLGSITWDLISTVAEENKTVGRLIPVVGMFINIGSIQDNLHQAEVTVAIYEPYPRPLPFKFP